MMKGNDDVDSKAVGAGLRGDDEKCRDDVKKGAKGFKNNKNGKQENKETDNGQVTQALGKEDDGKIVQTGVKVTDDKNRDSNQAPVQQDIEDALNTNSTTDILKFVLQEVRASNNGTLPPLKGKVLDRITSAVAASYSDWMNETGQVVPDLSNATFINNMAGRVIQKLEGSHTDSPIGNSEISAAVSSMSNTELLELALQQLRNANGGSYPELQGNNIDQIENAIADAYASWRVDNGRTMPASLNSAFIEDMANRVVERL